MACNSGACHFAIRGHQEQSSAITHLIRVEKQVAQREHRADERRHLWGDNALW